MSELLGLERVAGDYERLMAEFTAISNSYDAGRIRDRDNDPVEPPSLEVEQKLRVAAGESWSRFGQAGGVLVPLLESRTVPQLAFWEIADPIAKWLREERQAVESRAMPWTAGPPLGPQQYWLLFINEVFSQWEFLVQRTNPGIEGFDDTWRRWPYQLFVSWVIGCDAGRWEQYVITPMGRINGAFILQASSISAGLIARWCRAADYTPTPEAIAILEALRTGRQSMDQATLAAETGLARKTVGKNLQSLFSAGMINYPNGERKGAAILPKGRDLLMSPD